MTTTLTTPTGSARLAEHVLQSGKVWSLSKLDASCSALNVAGPAAALVRTIAFESPDGRRRGVVTGVARTFLAVGDTVGLDNDGEPARIVMTGAGCAYGHLPAYEIPVGSKITEIVR